MASGDDLYGWFSNLYEEAEGEYVKLKSVFNLYSCSEFYNNLTKADKRNFNYARFTEMVNENFHLKKYFKMDKNKGGYILRGWKLKEVECDIDNE